MPPPPDDVRTVELLAQRSDRAVLWMATSFAIGGALMDLASHALSAFVRGAGVGMLWGMWIPLCFFTIPAIHYLARRLQTLQTRVAQLEANQAPVRLDTAPTTEH